MGKGGPLKMSEIRVPQKDLKKFINSILLEAGVRKDVALHVTEGLVQTSLRGVDSHGIRLLPHYIAAVKGGRINPDPKYSFELTSASTGKLDADHTFGHAAGMEAVKKAVEIAKEAGSGHIAIYNSTHFGAAAYYTLKIAKHGMIGLSFTHADSLMKTYGGKRAFLGTNPVSFAAPVEGEEPFCLDMATTIYNFNKIKQLRDKKHHAPQGVGADLEGADTTDPEKISMLLPIGGYKGYGLGLMVEILCSIMTGMPFGPHIPSMYKAPLNEKRFLGHFISAIRIDCFQKEADFKRRLSELLSGLRNEPRADENIPVMVAGDPEKNTSSIRSKEGIPLKEAECETFRSLAAEYGIKFDF